MQKMRILGIDPGIGRTGWGIIDVQSTKLTVQSFGCIETEVNGELKDRILVLYEALKEIIEREKLTAVAVEELFFQNNAKTAMAVGQARGVVLLLAAQNNLPLAIYTPLQVKVATTGYGKAEKAQVGQMVKTILKLALVPKPDDTADALAIAITHAFSAKMPK
jgi:crossover junction endodeoxyribonuclease RuvC